MSNLLKIPLPGYPRANPRGGITWKGDYFGNNNYLAGGDKLYASDLGMVGIEDAHFSFLGIGSNSTYQYKALPPTGSANSNETYAPVYSSITVQAYTAANSTEVANNTNMSTVGARLTVNGI
jgi:hypothetical protein